MYETIIACHFFCHMHGNQNRRTTLFIDQLVNQSLMVEKNIVAKTRKLTVKKLDMRRNCAFFLANYEGVWMEACQEVALGMLF
jgi:hypothetical protein